MAIVTSPAVDVLRHAHIRDWAFGVLALIEKWGVEAQAEPRSKEAHERRTNGGVRVRQRS